MGRWGIAAFAAAICVVLQTDANAAAQTLQFSGNVFHVRACLGAAAEGTARCHAHIVTDERGNFLARATTAGTPGGYSPSQLRAAYQVTATGTSSTIVAIVDAYGDPDAESDLGIYRAEYGLPACTTANGCFGKYNESGVKGAYPALPSSQFGWSQETALDLAMVSAMCPYCKIVLVEANSSSYSDLAAAENTAARLGARAISNSYGGCEQGTQGVETAYNHPGLAITVSTGDEAYASEACGSGSTDNAEFPATSPHVTAVGGTTLNRASNARGWTESAWADGGSGCSAVYAKPVWQKDPLCRYRMEADVSAVADPSTPVAVYAPYIYNARTGVIASDWLEFGGTSVGAPLIAGIYGANGGTVSYGINPYAKPGAFNDVTSGKNGVCGGTYFCTALPGYDGPTGLGTPIGTTGF